MTLEGSANDQTALDKLAGQLTSGTPPAGLLGPSLPNNATVLSVVVVTWVCHSGQTLCLGMCVDAGSVVVTVAARGRYMSAMPNASDAKVGAALEAWGLQPSAGRLTGRLLPAHGAPLNLLSLPGLLLPSRHPERAPALGGGALWGGARLLCCPGERAA